jgi:hypothetical protein
MCKWTPLHSIIQYCICNIFPFLSFYNFWTVFCWTWCSPRLRSIIDNIPRSPPPFPYLPPWVEKEAMQSIELEFQMTPINTISSRKQKRFLHVVKFFWIVWWNISTRWCLMISFHFLETWTSSFAFLCPYSWFQLCWMFWISNMSFVCLPFFDFFFNVLCIRNITFYH